MADAQAGTSSGSVDDILITEQLSRRLRRAPDHEAENLALAALAQKMAADPRGVPQKLAELLVGLCHADSAGVSILEPGDGGHGIFRWHAIAGRFAANLGTTLPREAGPCGIVIDRNSVLLFESPARHFLALRDMQPEIREALFAPWAANGRATGTVWVLGHTPAVKFDAEDARLLQSLASFAAAACQLTVSFEQTQSATQALESRVAERTRLLSEGNERLQQEVEQRRQIEAALRESEARFRALAEASPASIWQVDPEGRAVYLNQRYLDVTGLSPQQLMATGWHSIVHPEDLPGYLSAFEEALRRRVPFHRRVRARLKDGAWHWFESYAAPSFSASEEYRGHVGLSIDITESMQVEQALKEADRRKNDFLATLAHELRNPLAPISNAIHLLRHAGGQRADDGIVEMVERQVGQMVRLIDDLMEVSRITHGKIELIKAPCPLAAILAAAIETSRPMIDQARLDLIVALPDEPLMLDADRTRLTQVFTNLLNNAARYTDAGGHIWIDAARDGNCVVVMVRDDGIGIPLEQLPHVFEMFAQIRHPERHHQGGLGIGLTMVRSLVDMHGGTVEARSAGPARGSEFIVRLPLLRERPGAPAEAKTQAKASAVPLSGRRILVVDDNHDAANTLCLLLEARGAYAEAVYDGRAALSAMEKMRPHAAILDIGMPGMDGYELARRIRRDARFNDVRLVALTGWGQEMDRIRSRASGFDHHLTKPVDLKALEALLARG